MSAPQSDWAPQSSGRRSHLFVALVVVAVGVVVVVVVVVAAFAFNHNNQMKQQTNKHTKRKIGLISTKICSAELDAGHLFVATATATETETETETTSTTKPTSSTSAKQIKSTWLATTTTATAAPTTTALNYVQYSGPAPTAGWPEVGRQLPRRRRPPVTKWPAFLDRLSGPIGWLAGWLDKPRGCRHWAEHRPSRRRQERAGDAKTGAIIQLCLFCRTPPGQS